MGLVLLGRDSILDQNVAIKMVKPDLVTDRQVTHLFVKEAWTHATVAACERRAGA